MKPCSPFVASVFGVAREEQSVTTDSTVPLQKLPWGKRGEYERRNLAVLQLGTLTDDEEKLYCFNRVYFV